LWARHAALQCCFNQESLDCLIVAYKGPIGPNIIFDPDALSAIVVHVNLKATPDTAAADALRPIGVPRDPSNPLPYLALLMELGTEAFHGKTKKKIKVATPGPAGEREFQKLTREWVGATQALVNYQDEQRAKGKEPNKKMVKRLVADIAAKQQAMDFYNRFIISVRGASPEVYGILNKADISGAFETLLRVAMPSPVNEKKSVQSMRPLEHLKDAHVAWMHRYKTREEDTDL
jgi:hypothetical protein